MFCSGKFVVAIVFGIAISLCLTVCSMPELVPQKASANHCHTDQKKEDQKEPQKHCCSAESILPAPLGGLFKASNQEMIVPEATVSTSKILIAQNRWAPDPFVQNSSPPPFALSLRI